MTASNIQVEQMLALLAAERPRFVAYLRARVGSDDAEDLLQQAMLRAVEKAEQLAHPDRAVSWFFTLLRRTVADYHAKRARRLRNLEHVAALSSEPSELQLNNVCACALKVVESLQPTQSEVLKRVDIDDEPLSDVAANLGISRNNATVRLHRARRTMRERLMELCGTQSVEQCMSCGC